LPQKKNNYFLTILSHADAIAYITMLIAIHVHTQKNVILEKFFVKITVTYLKKKDKLNNRFFKQ